MRPLSCCALAALLLGVAALAPAADPPPLVKPVSPAGGAARVRLAMLGKSRATFKALLSGANGKKPAPTEVTLAVTASNYPPQVSIQQWKAWGFEVPANRMAVLPELVIPGAQVAPKPAKGRDVELRLRGIRVSLYEAPGGEKGGVNNYLVVPLAALTGGADRQGEPRVHFADRFIELTAPNAALKKLNAGDATSPAPQVTADGKLLAAFVPMNGNVFAFATVNGRTQYTRATGKTYAVVAALEIGAGEPIVMPVNMARGCGVEMDAQERTGKVKELRLGPVTGPGVKGQKDFVLRDVAVAIDPDEDASTLWFNARFAETYFKDGVYACGPDGAWRLHGRVKPELLEDVKTRKPPAKKP